MSEDRTGCVVVGGGPGGVMLAHLLARGGVAVTLLESRGDFDRRFRGDSIAPPVLDYLDLLGVAEPMLEAIPHARADAFVWRTPDRAYTLADYRTASERYPFYALIPQAQFLPFMVRETQRVADLDVRMGARLSGLVRDQRHRVVGIEYTCQGNRRRLLADLVIGADGRNSKTRELSRIKATELGASLDICWFAVPRQAEDPVMSGLELLTEPGQSLAVLAQADNWQIGFTIPAGTFPKVRQNGVSQLRNLLRRRLPWLGDRIDLLGGIDALSLLPVRITSTDRWSEPGLMLIGDAAHVMSPVGGNGINLAIIDAAEAGNLLLGSLTEPVDPEAVDSATAHVERRRRPPVDREQRFQVRVERAAAQRLLTADPRPALPIRLLSSLPGFARWSARRSAKAMTVPAPPSVHR